MPTVARRGPVWLVLAASLATAGCAGDTSGSASPGPSTVESTSAQGHEGRFVGAITRSYEYGDPGITLAPPAASAKADVAWSAAFRACFTGPVRCVARGNAAVSLGMVTGPDNAIIGGRRMFDDALTYVLTWDPAPCVRPDLAGSQCRVVDLVTAQDGRLAAGTYVYSFEVAESSPVPHA